MWVRRPMSHTSTCTSSALPRTPSSTLFSPLILPRRANLRPAGFPPSPTTAAFPSARSPLRLIVCVLTGPCHSGADLWAARIFALSRNDSLLSEYYRKNTHTHSLRVRCTLASPPPHTHIPVGARLTSFTPKSHTRTRCTLHSRCV